MSAPCTISGASARNRVVPSDDSTARRITVAAEREHEGERKRAVERGLRRNANRAARDVRVRIRVRDDRVRAFAEQRGGAVVVEHAGADTGAPVVAPHPRVDGRDRERGVREIPLHLGTLLDLGHDRGVESRAEVEHEAASVGDAEADPAERSRGE